MAYKLTYFNMRGRAECVRMILAAAGQKFEDNRIKGEDWATLKPTTPWGSIPVLEEGGKVLAQTIAICRYLGRKFNMVGNDDWEAAKCDEYVDAMNDLFAEWVKFTFEKDPELKAKYHEEFKTNHLPKFLKKFNDIKAKNGGPYMVGKDLTWADIFLAEKVDRLERSEGAEVMDKYPNLKAFKEAVFAVPNIKAWVDQRPSED